MKPVATVDAKADMSTSEMGPVTIVQPEQRKRGVTGKHVLIACTAVLAVFIVVAGFVTATVLIQRTASETNEQMAKMFKVMINDGKEKTEEDVKTNTKEGTTETTDKDTKGNRQQTVFNDFKRAVTLYLSYRPGESDNCYVAPLNKSSEMPPDVLEKYLEDHPNPSIEAKEDKTKDRMMEPADEPIEDTAFLGQRINDLCRGRAIYWLFPEQTSVSTEETTTPAPRQKRSAYPYCPYLRLIILGPYPSCYAHCCRSYIRYRRYNYYTRQYYTKWVGISCIRHLINLYYSFCPYYRG